MAKLHGFELLEAREIPELNTEARWYRHRATGAELLSLENDDENKTFGITFRTPPPDSTGLPHIMEHAVLCGSRKYPVKEPFVELMKGSLNTFLNAFTFSDKTSYPVASQNLQDFYNLVDVYLDAVFYPRITPEMLAQEGWHYELDDLDAPLVYKGVVFNEMKGVYSSPESLVSRYSETCLFPEHVYGQDSGGDPEVIPNLTYAQFKTFHETYYHPSNARIFFYGDDDPEERLRLVQDYLQDYEARAVESAIPLAPRFDAPRRVTEPYPVSADTEDAKAYITVNWLWPENAEPAQTLALEILAHILVGTPASPLRKALIDSGLGEGVIGSGLDDSLRQLYFSTGLKGVRPQDVGQVEPLMLETLADLAEHGIEPEMVAAAVNTVEFKLREQNFGRYPRGVVQMIQALSTWLHGRAPFEALAFEAPLGRVKAALEANPRYFEGLIREHLLDNAHRVTLVLEPDAALQQRQEARESARLAEARAAMSEEELRDTLARARRLRQLQETPDSPEALATIPTLELADLRREARRVPTEVSELHGAQVLYHDLFTNGILYLDVGFDLHALPQDLVPYVPLFNAALLEIGTEAEDFVKLTQRIGRTTGGIETAAFSGMIRGTAQSATWAFLRSKATVAQVDDLLAILRDVLLTVRLDNRERFLQMLLEKKAKAEAQLVPAGHRVAVYRLRGKLDVADWATEQTSGVSYLFFLRRLIEQVEQDWPAVLAKLEAVRGALVQRGAMLCNVTLDAGNWAAVQPRLDEFLAALPDGSVAPSSWSPALSPEPEGLTIPAKVNYVAKGARLFDLGYERHGSIEVIANYLRATWIWEKVRIQGGAYGGFCTFDPHGGVWAYVSYRDPNLAETLANYDAAADFLRKLEITREELVKSIIGAIGTIDAYQLPDAKGYSAMLRALVGYTDAQRQQYREELLATQEADFHALGEVLARVAESGVEVVLGSREAIEAANAGRGEPFALTKVM